MGAWVTGVSVVGGRGGRLNVGLGHGECVVVYVVRRRRVSIRFAVKLSEVDRETSVKPL